MSDNGFVISYYGSILYLQTISNVLNFNVIGSMSLTGLLKTNVKRIFFGEKYFSEFFIEILYYTMER